MWWSCGYFKVIISTQIVVMWLLQSYSQYSDSSYVVVMWSLQSYFLIEEIFKTRRSNISFIDLLLDRASLNSIFLDAFLQIRVCANANGDARACGSARSNMHRLIE